MKKKIIMGVGIAVLLVAGYYLMTPRNSGSKTSTAIPSVTQKNNASTTPVVTTPAVNDATATNQNDMTASNATSNTDLSSETDDTWLGDDNNTAGSSSNTAPLSVNTASPSSNAPASTTASPAAASTSSDVPNDDSMQMQLQTLNMQNQTLALKLQQVTAQSEGAAARAASLEKTVTQLQTQMTKMNQMLQGGSGIQNSPPPLTRAPVTTRTTAAPTPSSNRATASTASQTNSAVAYYVQAIIPGRAWIADSNGHIVTVTQGDRLEALNSTVRDIDPINGIVTLSNGRQIEYGMVAQ